MIAPRGQHDRLTLFTFAGETYVAGVEAYNEKQAREHIADASGGELTLIGSHPLRHNGGPVRLAFHVINMPSDEHDPVHDGLHIDYTHINGASK
jgi:hypothetical protein